MAASLLSMLLVIVCLFWVFFLCLSLSLFLLLKLCIVTILLGVCGISSARDFRRALVCIFIGGAGRARVKQV